MRRYVSKIAVSSALSAVLAYLGAPIAAASSESFCHDQHGEFDGHYCHAFVTSARNADRYIKVAIPGELIDNPTSSATIRGYLGNLYDNWRDNAVGMAQDSYGEANFEIYHHRSVLSVVFREDYHADGPEFSTAYRTFSFDTVSGKQLALADVVRPDIDPFIGIPPLAAPYVVDALNLAPPPHQPGTYPFTLDRWAPDRVYSGSYRAWALTGDALVIYMPDYPVAHDVPVDYSPGMPVWSMNGGTVQAHVPLGVLSPVLRPEYV